MGLPVSENIIFIPFFLFCACFDHFCIFCHTVHPFCPLMSCFVHFMSVCVSFCQFFCILFVFIFLLMYLFCYFMSLYEFFKSLCFSLFVLLVNVCFCLPYTYADSIFSRPCFVSSCCSAVAAVMTAHILPVSTRLTQFSQSAHDCSSSLSLLLFLEFWQQLSDSWSVHATKRSSCYS